MDCPKCRDDNFFYIFPENHKIDCITNIRYRYEILDFIKNNAEVFEDKDCEWRMKIHQNRCAKMMWRYVLSKKDNNFLCHDVANMVSEYF